jgi:hypothetical protein
MYLTYGGQRSGLKHKYLINKTLNAAAANF